MIGISVGETPAGGEQIIQRVGTMGYSKVIEWVEIGAPREEVFQLVLNLERRMQLSPLWGVARVDSISGDYPNVGSKYHVRMLKDANLEYDTEITEIVQGRKLAYRLNLENETSIRWTFQDTARGTRVVYEESFYVPEGLEENLSDPVRKVVKQWLGNLKRYLELRDSRSKLLVKALLDRYYLKMRSDQRQVIQTLLVMQMMGTISFIMAALAMGLASLI
jgi:uncharacterized protein YndB with AHSA1/START domain